MAGPITPRLKWRVHFTVSSGIGALPIRFIDVWQYEHGGPIQSVPFTASSNAMSNADAYSCLTSPGTAWNSYAAYISGYQFWIDIEFDEPRPVSSVHWYTSSYSGNVRHAEAATVSYWDDAVSDWVEAFSGTVSPIFSVATPLSFVASEPAPSPVGLPIPLTSGTVYSVYDPANSLNGEERPSDGQGVSKILNGVQNSVSGPAEQSDSLRQPIFRESGINGRPYLELDGSRWMNFSVNIPSGILSVPPTLVVAVGRFQQTPGENIGTVVGAANLDNGGKARFALNFVEPEPRVTAIKSQMVGVTVAPGFDLFGALGQSTTLSTMAMTGDGDAVSSYVSDGTNPTSTAITTARLFATGATGVSVLTGDFYGLVRVEGTTQIPQLFRLMNWARGYFLGQFRSVSWRNVGAYGDRRNLNIGVWLEKPAESTATFSRSPITLLGGSGLFYQNGAGECRICFDFMEPRVIDSFMLYHSRNGFSLGEYHIQGSNDLGGPWTTLYSDPAAKTSSTNGTEYPFSNSRAFRYYCLYRPSGNGSTAPYFNRVEFRIDDNADLSWWTEYSIGDRSGLVSVDGTAFRYSVLPQNTVTTLDAWANVSNVSLWAGRTTGSIDLTFTDPVALTGFRWSKLNDGAVWDIQARNSASDPWETLSAGRSFVTSWSQASLVGSFSFSEVTWENDSEFLYYRFVVSGGVTGPQNTLGGLTLKIGGATPPPPPGVAVTVPAGTLSLSGSVPTLEIENNDIDALPGTLTLVGSLPSVVSASAIEPVPGVLVLSGGSPIVSTGVSVQPDSGHLVIAGGEPILYTVVGSLASQLAVMAIGDAGPPPVLASQVAVMAVAEPPPPPVRASQAAVMAIGEVVPDVCMSQVAALVIGHQTDCVTSLCQIWKITRRDGKVYRYTSLDRDLVFGGNVYKACGSLDPSASDNSSIMGSVGSQTLTGIIRDDGISEAELFGGLFDDAYVTSDLVSFDDPTFVPRRLASGWIGQITQGRVVHSLEVVSIGARIEQQALVRVVSPTCSHKFGDAGCGVNVEAMKIPAEITRVMDRGLFYVSVVNPGEDARQWANGRVRFLDGVNAGVVREFKSIDFATGLLSLWALTGLAPAPGDKIEILPGCDLTREGGCTAYANIINFGGFPDVPGTDAVLETPNAKI